MPKISKVSNLKPHPDSYTQNAQLAWIEIEREMESFTQIAYGINLIS